MTSGSDGSQQQHEHRPPALAAVPKLQLHHFQCCHGTSQRATVCTYGAPGGARRHGGVMRMHVQATCWERSRTACVTAGTAPNACQICVGETRSWRCKKAASPQEDRGRQRRGGHLTRSREPNDAAWPADYGRRASWGVYCGVPTMVRHGSLMAVQQRWPQGCCSVHGSRCVAECCKNA